MLKYSRNDQGMIALLTTVFVSILMSVITVAMVKQMVSELRQAGDYEQSQRAYYAARAGVEDAVARVINSVITNSLPNGVLPVQDDCQSNNYFKDLTGTVASYNDVRVGWTCQRIYYGRADGTKGRLSKPDVATQVDASGAPYPYDTMELSWDMASRPSIPGAASLFPSAGGWSSSTPPPLEITVVRYPTGAFNGGSTVVGTANALFYPTSLSNRSINIASFSGANPVAASCANRSGADYNCKIILNGFDSRNYNYIFRVRSRYSGTDWRMIFKNGGVAVAVPDGSATLDVTSKVGNAYRRLLYKLPYNRGASAGLDYVIYSDNGFAKNCQIDTDRSYIPSCY